MRPKRDSMVRLQSASGIALAAHASRPALLRAYAARCALLRPGVCLASSTGACRRKRRWIDDDQRNRTGASRPAVHCVRRGRRRGEDHAGTTARRASARAGRRRGRGARARRHPDGRERARDRPGGHRAGRRAGRGAALRRSPRPARRGRGRAGAAARRDRDRRPLRREFARLPGRGAGRGRRGGAHHQRHRHAAG